MKDETNLVMAHSYIYVKEGIMERSVGVPDSILRIFMLQFNQVVESKNHLTQNEKRIYNHYNLELIERHTSCIDLKLQEIGNDAKLKNWFLSLIPEIGTFLEASNFIDIGYLNRYPNRENEFDEPVSVLWIRSLINDILWVLGDGNKRPSQQYKYFETKLSRPN